MGPAQYLPDKFIHLINRNTLLPPDLRATSGLQEHRVNPHLATMPLFRPPPQQRLLQSQRPKTPLHRRVVGVIDNELLCAICLPRLSLPSRVGCSPWFASPQFLCQLLHSASCTPRRGKQDKRRASDDVMQIGHCSHYLIC